MGFKNSSAIFQRFMDWVLRKEIGKNCYVYVDDILVFGRTKVEHDKALERIMDILRQHKLIINEQKSSIGQQKIEFVGHIISHNCIIKKLDNEEAVENYQRPKNRKDVQRFIGLVNHYRKFIPNMARVGKPLYDLLKQEKKWVWGDAKGKAFQELKDMLLAPTVLRQPNYKQSFILETDACGTGLGAILSQREGKEEFPIAYASRMLTGAELNYSISEKECLGALWGMEKFRYYLYGTEFLLRTDHKALERLNSGPLKSARIERWIDRLNNFSFKVEYRKGESIPHVDALSRQYGETNGEVKGETTVEINEVVLPHEEPDEMTKRSIIQAKHEELVHRGAKIVATELAQQYQWKGMSRLVKDVVSTCRKCKMYGTMIKGPHKAVLAFEMGEKVAFDIMGPIQNSYVISAIDYFTRRAWSKRLTSRDEGKILQFLKMVHAEVHIKQLICDQAKEHLGRRVREWTLSEGIKQHFTTPYHHRSNGRIERYNRTLLDGLSKGKVKGSLDARIKKVVEVYNEVTHSAIGMSPNDASDPTNWGKLRKRQCERQVATDQHQKDVPKLRVSKKGERVLVKDEVGVKKGEPKFTIDGQIVEMDHV
ncbi:hypothetical protein PAPHI01_2686 [Pancytospora philotis]|nr:hypothetical protein PAPHI01_2686 [Pancytospora philotis]